MKKFRQSMSRLVEIVAIDGPLAAQGTCTGRGRPRTYLNGISADGTIAVGVRSDFGPAFRWKAAERVVKHRRRWGARKDFARQEDDLPGTPDESIWLNLPNGRRL
jgi:hypothetical protein